MVKPSNAIQQALLEDFIQEPVFLLPSHIDDDYKEIDMKKRAAAYHDSAQRETPSKAICSARAVLNREDHHKDHQSVRLAFNPAPTFSNHLASADLSADLSTSWESADWESADWESADWTKARTPQRWVDDKNASRPQATTPVSVPPWHGTLPSIARSLRADFPTFRYILTWFFTTRAVLVAIGLVSYAAVPKGYGKQVAWSSWPWLDMWGVWDSLWYMDIAQNGYSLATKLADFPDQTNFPFFPLYPLLMRFLSHFTNGDPFIAGLIISNVCLLLSCYFLYKLIEKEGSRRAWNGSAIARRSIKYLFLFPVSFIFSGVFTESLYLCLSLLCFYLAKQRQWWLAGLCGGLLSATRTLGVLIAIPLLLEYARSIDFRPDKVRLNSLFVALVPLGLLAFSYHNYQATGDLLFFKTNQAAWDREIMNPLSSFLQAASQGLLEPSFKKLLECAFFVGAFGLLSAFHKKIGLSYWLMGMYSLLIPLSAGVASMPRFTLPIFPLFVILAIISRRENWNLWLTVALGGLQGALMVLWCTGQGLVI